MNIGADNVFGLMAAFLALAALAALLERTPIGQRLSGVVLVMLGAVAASHFGVLPRSAPFYGAIWTYLVPLAIALFLLKADLVKVFSEGGRVLLGFFAGMVGATVGALLGAAFLDLGANEQKLAAVYSATYTGGSLNFVAVAEAVNFTDASDLAAALAIDNILGVAFIVMVNLAAGWAFFQRRFHWRSQSIFAEGAGAVSESASPSLSGLLTALACAAAVVAISEGAASALGLERYALLFLTVLMTAAATVGRRFLGRLNGEELIAMILMYLFFAVIGAGADINGMLASAPPLFIFVLTIFAVHLIFLLAAGALLKLNHAELLIASLACITGPPVAAAIAIMMKWRNLVAPGILTGILGYVLGNFIVIAMILMYLFFAVIGAGADINGMLASAPPLFIFVLTIFAVHLVFLLAAGALLKLNYAELLIASLACITGPPVAAAIAIMMKWRNLVAPGILTGILGYVLGNFIGIGVFTLLGGNLQ